MSVDIITMGEMLIDFVPLKKGLSFKENKSFIPVPGGAPANVAVGVAKLGSRSAFFGKVGKDPFGDLLIDTLKENGVETGAIIQTDKAKTTLAFITLDETGERDFTFYRDPGADMLYQWKEVNQELFRGAKVFHHGSISLINEPVRKTTINMIQQAKQDGIVVSYDPNLRIPLWPDKSEAKHWIIEGLKTANIVKIAADELEFITGEKDIDTGVKIIMKYGIDLLFVTLGAEGCYYYNGKKANTIPGYKVNVHDTTGAGDGFVAGLLYQLINSDISQIKKLSNPELEEIVYYANAVGALTTEKKGAINALPDQKKVNTLIRNKIKK